MAIVDLLRDSFQPNRVRPAILETTGEYPSDQDRIVSEVKLLSEIAKANGSLLSLKDITTLTKLNLSEQQLEAEWSTIPGLAEIYELKNGFMLEREAGNIPSRLALLESASDRQARAERYVRLGKEFASFLRGSSPLLVAISGSASYQTVSERDDLDFFCVTNPDSLWVFLTKSLLLSRLFRTSRKGAPRICFSYAVDERFADGEFATSSDALFARDALTTIVVHGAEFYKRLLKRSSWISNYFPQLYNNRSGTADREETQGVHNSPSPSRKFLNHFLSLLVGNYISAKSALLNRQFRKKRRLSSLFTVRIGPDHCIFESARYSRLRTMYAQYNADRLILEVKT